MPLLSIIVPVYNKVEYIDACINSILNQTFKDFELILVNDGSTDGSALKCEKYTSDSRVKVLHQENKGVSMARNYGLAESSGSFIGFIDSDDTIDNDMYEILIRNACLYKADISVCSMKCINPLKKQKFLGKNKAVEVYNKDEALSLSLKGRFWASANNKIYKAEIAKNIEFEGKVNEDLFYTFLAFSEANKTVFQDVEKYKYYVRSNSVSISKFNPSYMETIYTSRKIVEIISRKMKSHLEDAQSLDFSNNISMLNLLLLAGTKNYYKEYDLVKNNLNQYSGFLKNTNSISKKQRYAYYIFKRSPKAYSFLLRLYSSLFAKDLIHITS